jgi:outer membrane protein assembly complex protein YaeT
VIRVALAGALAGVLAVLCPAVLRPTLARAEIPDEILGRPITEVVVEGEARGLLDHDDVHLPLGEPLDRAHLRRAALLLLGSGEWADVSFDAESVAGGVRVRVSLVPRILVARIEIEGSETLAEQTVRELVGVSEGGEITGAALGQIRTALKEALAERGFVDAEVDATLRDTDSPSRKVLRVVVREGEPIRVARLRFVAARPGTGITGDEAELAPPEAVDVRGALGVGVGDVLDRRRLAEGVRAAEVHLRERGFFEAALGEPVIDLREGVVTLPLHVGHAYRVEIRGAAPLERSDVEAVLELTTERLTRPVVENVRLRVAGLYRRHGFRDVAVLVRRTHDPERTRQDDGSLDPAFALLAVEIVPGPRLRVVGVSFPGATHFAPELLRDQIRSYLEEDLPSSQPFEPVDDEVVDRLGLSGRSATARRSVAAHIVDVPASVWMESTYAEAVEHITELYQAAGYLDAAVGPAELRELEEHVAVVTVPVYEGPRTLVFDVRVRGNELLSSHEVLTATRLARGEAFSYVTLEEARRRVQALYQDRGHLFARVEPVVNRSGDRERAEIVFDVVERFPVTVGDIRVEGLEATEESLVRQALLLRSGELYRPEVARQSEDALLRLGIFSSVSITPVDPELAERVKDVVVTVAERLPQELALSAGIGTGEGARGSFEYAYRNLFGYAVSLSLRVQLAFQFFFQDQELEQSITALSLQDRLERRITIGLAVPHIPGLRDVRAGLDLVHLRDNFRDFGLDKNGAVLTLSYQPDRRFQGSLSTEIEQNTVGLFGDIQDLQDYLAMTTDPRIQRLLRVPQGVSAIASVRGVLSLDMRDSAFTPTDGVYASAAVEWAHTVYTENEADYSHFFKATLTINGYLSLAEGWVLALQARGGRVFHLEGSSRTYPNRAYFMGGVDSLRGFLQDQVIPQDQVDLIDREGISPTSIVRTGDFFYLGRAELRFPIAGDLQGGVFADLGNVWAFADAMSFEDLGKMRVSAGLGLRLSTPVGPIAADYGVNLTRRSELGEPFGAFHFSIGLF